MLSPEIAAWLATSGELGLSALLALGLFGRFAAAGLFILNAVTVASYYSELSEAGINQHLYWGMLLAVLLVSRSPWSADAWLERQFK